MSGRVDCLGLVGGYPCRPPRSTKKYGGDFYRRATSLQFYWARDISVPDPLSGPSDGVEHSSRKCGTKATFFVNNRSVGLEQWALGSRDGTDCW